MRASFFNIRRVFLIILISILFITMVFDKPIQAGAALPNVRVVLNYPKPGNSAKTISEFKINKGEYALKNKDTDIPGFTQTDSFKAEFVSGDNLIRVSKKNPDGTWTSIGAFTGPILLKGNSTTNLNVAMVDGKLYRGDIEIRVNYSGTGLNAINELLMDQYLYGVVPSEMSASWPIEALKAQSVAARTFAVKKAGVARKVTSGSSITTFSEGFELFSDTRDQAYDGYTAESKLSETHKVKIYNAVDTTTGKVIKDQNGILIDASYHSNSGGYTEDSENIWSSAVPYLRGKADPYSMGYGFSNWNYQTTADIIKSKVGSPDVIEKIELTKYTSGRVREVIITDIKGNTTTKSGSSFGYLFNPSFYTHIGIDQFMSRLFDFNTNATVSIINGEGQVTTLHGGGNSLKVINGANQVTGLNGTDASYTVLGGSTQKTISKAPTGQIAVEGHGWGHGVGMSQWGAYGMAQQGFKYEDILKFYYTGVKVQ